MPAVTDLTWRQLDDALKQLTGATIDIIRLDNSGAVSGIDIAKVLSSTSTQIDANDPMSTTGVIKFITRLYDACKLAQETANQNKATGEKLSAFGVATAAAPKGTLVPITRTMTTQADLSSATRIVGTNV